MQLFRDPVSDLMRGKQWHYLEDTTSGRLVANSFGQGSVILWGQGLSVLSSFGTSFDNHYYKNLMRGRGVLFADQQLMANEKTAAVVMDYALDEGTIFRTEFAHAMDKLSNIGVLTGSQGEVRHSCSHINSDQ
ncbi:PREDICTED: peroxidase 49-like [Nicotiana attenuata]|uniref:peroxidase 49-like n=1 Tax=Nicotiana attenuata TaxID=49451 RepID=UPI000904FDAD|nr:PREDICTED: peroxidase 49-like [Nicotiana attenuata]